MPSLVTKYEFGVSEQWAGVFGRLFALRQVDYIRQLGQDRADLGRSIRGGRWVAPEGALEGQPGVHVFAWRSALGLRAQS